MGRTLAATTSTYRVTRSSMHRTPRSVLPRLSTP
jgi:hypothetical protein